MTPERQELVRASWRHVEPDADRFAELGIQHFLEITPHARPFLSNVPAHELRARAVSIVDELTGMLDAPERLVPRAVAIGQRSAAYGIDGPAAYENIGESLLWTLHQLLGSALTPELRSAWLEAYNLVAAVMHRAEQVRTGEFDRVRTGDYTAVRRNEPAR